MKLKEVITLVNAIPQSQQIDEDSIVAKVLQKLPQNSKLSQDNAPDIEPIVELVMNKLEKRMNLSGAMITFVDPLTKIKDTFLNETKNKILNDIKDLSTDAQKVLKYMEVRKVGVKTVELITKCFMLKPGGSSSTRVNNALRELDSIQVIRREKNGNNYAELKSRISIMIRDYDDESQIDLIYDHILSGLIGE